MNPIPNGKHHSRSLLPSCCDRVRRDTSEGVVVGPCEPLLEDLGPADPFWKLVGAEIKTPKSQQKRQTICQKTGIKPTSGKKRELKQSVDKTYPWKVGAQRCNQWQQRWGVAVSVTSTLRLPDCLLPGELAALSWT